MNDLKDLKGGNNFGFKQKPSDVKKEDNIIEKTPLSDNDSDSGLKDDLSASYVDKRTITISTVKTHSLYREVNRVSLPNKIDYIGSSIHSSRVLSSNKNEIEAYFPQIVGLSPNNPEFIQRVKQYLNNIQVSISALGRTFDISFNYNRKEDYYIINRKQKAIEDKFNAVNKNNLTVLKSAIKQMVVELNDLESTKHKYGHPVNLEDYIMYRHCLLYNDVAKDLAIINSDSSYRFYIKDDIREANKLAKQRNQIIKAKTNYVTCISDKELFNSVYVQYCAYRNLPIIASLQAKQIDKEIALDKFSQDEPNRFNKIFSNKNVVLIGDILQMIARNILIKSKHSQNVSSPDNEFIGANIGEVVAWFNNPENKDKAESYINQLKNI